MDVWVCLKRKEKECRIERTVELRLESVSSVIKKDILRWFGDGECTDDTDWIKRCTAMEVEGTKPRGCQRKIWWGDPHPHPYIRIKLSRHIATKQYRIHKT